MGKLPIVEFEEKIIETVERNPVVVVIGETGSGKSTQLSQMLHRRGFTRNGAVAVTQPRRVAAVSVARRVAQELGVKLGEEVGYAIRFEDRTSDSTRIKYLTDGVLLRESLSDPELKQYSVIILDEAHERSMNTDILLGLMKRLAVIRASNLKILITSATLDGEKVSEFFSGCPILNVPGKLYPVEILYSKERPKNYLESSLKTAIGTWYLCCIAACSCSFVCCYEPKAKMNIMLDVHLSLCYSIMSLPRLVVNYSSSLAYYLLGLY